MSNSSKGLSGFVIGAAIGAAAGVAVGYFLNSDKKDEYVNALKEKAGHLKDKAGHLKDKASEFKDKVKHKLHNPEEAEDAIAG